MLVPVDCILQVSVVEYDRRAFPSKFERDPLEVALGRQDLHSLSGGNAARKAHFGDSHVRSQQGPSRAIASQDLKDTGWETGLQHQFSQLSRHEGRFLAWLDDDNIASRQGGRSFHCNRGQRAIPWKDTAID